MTVLLRSTALAGAALAVAVLAGCATRVGVRPIDALRVHRNLTRNVLSTGDASASSRQVLHRSDLYDRFQREPAVVLAELHAGLAPRGDEDRVFALAELSFVHAERGGGPSYFRAAAVYAYAYLFPARDAAPPDPLDPRLRVAADLYNRGLTEGLRRLPGDTVDLESQTLPLPFGQLEITTDPRDFVWGRLRMEDFHAVADLAVQGLRNRYRRPGIGAPLAAELEEAPVRRTPAAFRRVPTGVKVPLTAFLRIQEPRRALTGGLVQGTMELYTSEDASDVRVDGRRVPLERESSSALAFNLAQSSFGGFELDAFFGSELVAPGEDDGILMLRPYRPGRIPVVLVHGTASSPSWWGELLNELQNDPALHDRFQFWLFTYNTGNPILYSAGLLREALTQTLADLDPGRTDPALRRMVVVGHSQGGLLTKLTVVDSGDAFWANASLDASLDELDIDPATRHTLRRSLFFEPLPFVRTVIFMSTPHRGSFLATRPLASLVARLVSLPQEIVTLPFEVADRLDTSPEAKLARRLRSAPSSIENMTPGQPFLKVLETLPIADGVSVHSIVAVTGDGPVETGDDGVVAYTSAHLEDVDSEVVIPSSHSVQTHPLAIAEVARILEEVASQP